MAVLVYSTNTCPYCIMAKQYLKQKGVDFEEVDVSADEGKAQEMIVKSNQQGVPVIDFNGKIIVGFNKTELDKEIKKMN
ncbi:MAG: glutaredoxin domain-containing protein [Candidatus Diapherotrites archaeon]